MMSNMLSLASLPFYGLRVSGLFLRSLGTFKKVSPSTTVDPEEVHKFTSKADDGWWGEPYRLLRSLNALRVPWVRDGILSVAGSQLKNPYPLEGYKIIDVGCGGGILCEPIARLGACVTGLDPGQENIDMAIRHALPDEELKDRLDYICDTVENLAKKSPNTYDALICSEVIEHVANVPAFVKSCVELTKNGGSIFISTINRSALSYLVCILAAEYMLRLVPIGTHEWNKFVKPEELLETLKSLDCRIISMNGWIYNPMAQKWSWTSSTNMYTVHAVK